MEVVQRLTDQGSRTVLVGGAVRNAFLSRPIPDWDIATSLTPPRVAALFERVVRAGEKHGTIMVLTAIGAVEVTTFRGEGLYLDGRRPSHVTFHDDLRADLSRRDFTINAMAADLGAGQVIDPFGGRADLERRRVRCVGDPRDRFAEDGLRPLRAVRFAGLLGFRLERATRSALSAALPTFVRVAWERKRDEIERLLARAEAPSYALRVLRDTGMLEHLASGLSAGRAALAAVDRIGPDAPWLRFATWATASGLPARDVAAVLARRRVATRDARAVRGWMAGAARLGRKAPRGADLRRWVAETGAEHATGAARLAAARHPDAFGRFPAAVTRLLASSPALCLADLAVSGDDLTAIGLRGRAVGRTLEALLQQVLEEPHQNRRETLLDLAHSLSTGISQP
jgi:tRNA nucleotidyltransferase (CCA-adding enzyme)